MYAGSSAGEEAARNLRAAEELRKKAARLEERAAAYTRGRQGELVVARALDELTVDGYCRIDDCRWPGRPKANIDHVLIGPAGLFVVDAKNWSGRVEVRAGVLRQSGYRRSREVDATVEAARAVAGLLSVGVPRVEGVICLCGEAQIPPMALGDGRSVVAVAEIARWIRSQPALLTPTTVASVQSELIRLLESASRTAAATARTTSRVPDYVPHQWSGRPVQPERSVGLGPSDVIPPQRRFSKQKATVGRVLLLLLMLDAVVTAALSSSDRVGNVVVFIVCLAWLVRLEQRRPVVTTVLR